MRAYCVYIYHFLFVHSPVDGCLDFHLLAFMNNTAWTFLYMFLCRHVFISLGYITRGKFLGHMVILCFTFWETIKLFLNIATPLQSHQQCLKVSVSPFPHQYLLSSVLFILVIFVCVVWFSLAFSWLLMMLSIFPSAYWSFVCILWKKYLFRFFAHFLFYYYYYWLVSILYVFWIHILCQEHVLQIF